MVHMLNDSRGNDRAMSNEQRRLLILACSQRKRPHPCLLAAIDRYDGPTFRVLRRSLRTELPHTTDVYILSAEFGLIPASQPTPNYDRRMTIERARALRPSVVTELNKVFTNSDYVKVFICMGQIYLNALEGFDESAPPSDVTWAVTGSLGRRLSQLHDWLNGCPPLHHDAPQLTAGDRRITIRGVEIQETAAHVLDVARQGLDDNADGVNSYQSWYVSVEARRVAPKWLVSQLSGLPVSAFATGEACRVLMQLGIAVERV